MVLTLAAITLISAGALSVVYSMTEEAIQLSKAAKTLNALGNVLPDFDNDPSVDTVTVIANNLPAMVYTAMNGSLPAGYAVETVTRLGYSGEIRFIVGFLPNGDIYNIEVLEHAETPGLGSKIKDDDNPVLLSFKGKNPADLVMKVTKDGGDIDVITASTISSRAYTDAVERAYIAFREVALGEEQTRPEAINFVAAVLPAEDNGEELSITAYNGTHGEIFVAYTTSGDLAGIAVESTTEGYGGPIRLLVGFSPGGTVYDIAVIEQMETPGFGAEIEEHDNPLAVSFRGHDPGKMKIAFRSENGDVDGISGSSITSQAYMDAVANAYRKMVKFKELNERDE